MIDENKLDQLQKKTPNTKTTREELNELKEGDWLMINSPIIEYRLTGTDLVGIMKDGTIKVRYIDGKIEERKATDAILDTDATMNSVMNLVAYVQGGR